MKLSRFALVVSLCFGLGSSLALAQTNTVNGNLFTLTNISAAPNGVWSWFEDERAIIDTSAPGGPRLLVSSVSAGAAPENGDIDLLWRNLTTGAQGHFELANQLEQDDHNSAALYIRPDGRYLAMYSRHITDNLTRWRVSTNPNDPTSWGAEQTLVNGAGTTYNNVYYLAADNNGAGRTYNFTRTLNFDPNVQISSDNGSTWSNAGKLLTEGGGGDRPYLRYASNGEKIFFMATERHPRNFANSVYAGYVQDGTLYRMDGSVADANLFDGNGVAPATLTTVFANGSQFNGNTLTRAWTIHTEVDKAGNPVGIISARVNENNQDHRFLYARFDGIDWQVNEMAKAGGFLYAAEDDYTGLVSIDPDNPNVVYMSTDIDPRSGLDTARYELYKGFTGDFGKTWSWTAITENSTMDNIRPVVPQWNGQQTAVTWLRGTYTTFTNWSTEVVGINFTDTDPKALLWRGDAAGAATAWNNASTSNWDSGGNLADQFNAGDEVTFSDSASSTTVNVQSTVTPMSVTFSNKNKNYTLTGTSGIAGSGGLRVIGGGRVTLNNGNNTYTGDTNIAIGTLAIANTASISGSGTINVASGGTLDVSAATGGAYSLNNQDLVVKGTVVGNITANQSSNVQLDSPSAFNGSLQLNSSSLQGVGTIANNLVAANGSVIQVSEAGITLTNTFAYLDATTGATGNTRLTSGAALNAPNSTSGANTSTWVTRTGLANQGTVLQGGADAPNTLPTIMTTISGLTPGKDYQVFANFWDASPGSAWRIQAGSSPANLTLFAAPGDNVLGATPGLDPRNLNYGTTPLIAEGNRSLWGGDLGFLTADANGQITVYIDDAGTNIGDDRAWYDGLTYQTDNLLTSGHGTLFVNGNFSIDATSELRLDLGSTSSYDRLVVGGTAMFGGVLRVNSARPAAELALGETFDLFDFSSSLGQFNALELPSLDTGLVWDTSRLYTEGRITISTPAAIPEPSSIAVLAVGVLSLIRRSRRTEKS